MLDKRLRENIITNRYENMLEVQIVKYICKYGTRNLKLWIFQSIINLSLLRKECND